MSSASEKRRRQKEERDARRQAERKAAARRELIRRVVIALALGGVVAAILLVGAALSQGEGEQLPPNYEAYREQPTACGAEPPPPPTQTTYEEAEPQNISPDSTVTATIVTSCGEIVLELAPERSPLTVESFVFLARAGFYDGTVFHRIVENFVVQGGDPTASGSGGPGYRVPDELPPEGFSYEPGTVAMANAGSGTTGSQFFIVVGERASALPPSFNLLGEVVEGFDTLERITQIPVIRQPTTVEESRPTETVYIESVEIEVTG